MSLREAIWYVTWDEDALYLACRSHVRDGERLVHSIRGRVGDTVYDDAVLVPHELPAGKYALRVAMLDTWTGKPRIDLAQEGRGEDGWYELGEVKVV